MDPALEPVLTKALFKRGGFAMLALATFYCWLGEAGCNSQELEPGSCCCVWGPKMCHTTRILSSSQLRVPACSVVQLDSAAEAFYVTTKMANPHYLPEVCIKAGCGWHALTHSVAPVLVADPRSAYDGCKLKARAV